MRYAPGVRFSLALLLVLVSGCDSALAEEGSPRPRIGLVLSGGGARGGAHIGVIRVLEEMRVPIDVVVGTSAGAIVGAAYASGLPLPDIEAEMKGLSTAGLFHDQSREDVPYRRKRDDASNYIGPELGVRGAVLSLPKAAVAGVSLEAVLRHLTRRQATTDFDRLPIPFRAIATDLSSGEMVVLDRGSLAAVVRASMAIPGVVNPVEIDDRLLVDGGLTRNLGVDIAREMGADIVIAVNVATPLLMRERITSLLEASEQTLTILTEANVRQSIGELKSNDVLITPELDRIASSDFNHLSDAARQGELAARAKAPVLARYSVDEGVHRNILAARSERASASEKRIDEIRVTGTHWVNPQAVRAAMDTAAGEELDTTKLEVDLKRIYGRGDFESINYTLIEQPGEPTVLAVAVTEKSWGPNYLRFGLSLSSDFEGGSYFNLLASHRWTWLNRLGAEWRNDLQIGRNDRLRTEWYQPLTERQRVFVAPYAQFERDPFDIFDEHGKRLARFRIGSSGGGVDVGAPIGTTGEARLGLYGGRVKVISDTFLPPGEIALPDVAAGAVRLQVALDRLDNLRFPRSGYSAHLLIYDSHPSLGAADRYTKASLALTQALATGPHSLQLGLRAGGALGERDLPGYELFTLGGFLELSGYKTGQFVGDEVRFARVVYNYRLTGPALLDGGYLGASLEAGRIGATEFSIPTKTRYGSSVYVAADTPIGPVYLAYGRASGNNQAVYFYLGRP